MGDGYKIDLQVKDLIEVVKVIDICAERGAFKGHELEFVGSLRGRFTKHIQSAKENFNGGSESNE